MELPSSSMQMDLPPEANGRNQPILKLPELIEKLAQAGEVIKWDSAKNWYEVIDAKGFETQFNALRCVRGKRKENAADRPFARMHIHFVLVRGEKWAGAGSAFRPKTMVCSSRQELRSQELRVDRDITSFNSSEIEPTRAVERFSVGCESSIKRQKYYDQDSFRENLGVVTMGAITGDQQQNYKVCELYQQV